MNCGVCGAWTLVRETRKADRGFSLKRTRECANGHTFATFEVLASIYRSAGRRKGETLRAAEARAIRAKRDAQIVKACRTRSQTSVAAEFGLTQARVSRIVLAAARA